MNNRAADFSASGSNLEHHEIVSLVEDVFCRVLNLDGANHAASFFELGGQSLQASRLVGEIGARLGRIIPLKTVFQYHSIAALAEELGSNLPDYPVGDEGAPELDGGRAPNVAGKPCYEPFPLNEVQYAYWIGRGSFFELGNTSTHVYVEFENDDIDHDRFERAWNRLVKRHEMLRCLINDDGTQTILPYTEPIKIPLRDYSALPEREARAEGEKIRSRMSHQILDPAKSLYEISVSRFQDKYVIHCSLDLLIADLWSTQIIFKELQMLYDDVFRKLPDIGISFRDCVLYEQTIQTSAVYRKSEDYWKKRIDSLPSGPQLPIAVKPKTIEKPRFKRRTQTVNAVQWQGLKNLASRHGLTPSTLLCAAYAEVLSRWCNSDHFTLNLTLFNRHHIHKDVMNVVGDFTTLILLEVDHRDGGTFLERAKRLQSQLWEDIDHRYYSGIKVMRDCLKSNNSLGSRFPVIFTSGLVHENQTSSQFLGKQVYGISQTPQIWLDHQVFEENGNLVFNWDAVEALFPEALLDDMFASYCELLGKIVVLAENSDVECRAMLPGWQESLMRTVNETGNDIDANTLVSLFEKQCAKTPGNAAVVCGDTRLSYAELHVGMQALAARIAAFDPVPGAAIVVSMHQGWEQAVAVLAVQYLGCAYVPIDPQLPFERRQYIAEETGARLVVTQEDLIDEVKWGDTINVISVAPGGFANPPAQRIEAKCRPQDVAYILYTSGSTGRPKGVIIDHRAAVNTICDVNERFSIGANDAVLNLSSLSFDLSVFDIFGTFAAGAKLVVPTVSEYREPRDWLRLIQNEDITVWNTVPAIASMLEEYCDSLLKPVAFDMRLFLLSGDWIPVKLPDKLKRLCPGCRVVSLGGATEASIWSIYFEVAHVDASWSSIPYGKPLGNQSFRVLDKNLRNTPVWTTGDLYIGGEGLALGYLSDAEKTADKFIDHPETKRRLYKTGDLGRYLLDGNIEFLGRSDFQVKVQGHRIELGEIETCLRLYPGIDEAIVNVGEGGRGEKVLLAYVTCDNRDVPALFVRDDQGGFIGSDAYRNALEQTRRVSGSLKTEIAASAWNRLYRELDELTATVTAQCFNELGLFRDRNVGCTVPELLQRAGVLERYDKWLNRALGFFVEDGFMTVENGRYKRVRDYPVTDASAAWKDLIKRVHAAGFTTKGLEFAARSAEKLSGALRGKEEAVSFLFAEGQSTSAEDMYEEEFRYCNDILRKAFGSLVATAGAQRKTRVLEIGAGIGSSTRYLLEEAAAADHNLEYVFTDISLFFLSFGREKFAAYDFVGYDILDIQETPVLQGFDRHDYDIVVASSVLHATRDLHETINNVKALLKPSGVLLLIEETAFPRVFNLTMGLQQGFDHFEDYALRPVHPLLSEDGWRGLLHESGFTGIEVFVERDTAAAMMGLQVIVAKGPAYVARINEAAVSEFLRTKLPDYMVPQHIVELDVFPTSANGKVLRDKLSTLVSNKAREFDYKPPNTVTERRLAEIWESTLNTRPIGIDQNFFHLGGDSLLATRVVARINAHFALDLPIRLIFEEPFIASLASRIENSSHVTKAVEDCLELES